MKPINALNASKHLFQFDNDLGYWGVPNATKIIETPGYSAPQMEIKNNSFGFRDIEPEFNLESGCTLVYGGSHSWGAGLLVEERYSNLLANAWGKTVLNLAQPSFGIDQIATHIIKNSAQFRPQKIIIEQYPWAIIRAMNASSNGFIKPRYYVSKNGKLTFSSLKPIYKWALVRKFLSEKELYQKKINEHISGLQIEHNYDPALDPMFTVWTQDYYSKLYELVTKIYHLLKQYCDEKNIELLVVTGVCWQALKLEAQSVLVDYRLPNKKLKKIFDDVGIKHLDMSSILIEKNKKTSVIFDDGHINQYGHELFAKQLVKQA